MQTVRMTVASIHIPDGKLTKTDQEIADILCNYLGEVFTKEDVWKQNTASPLKKKLEILITEELVLKAIKHLKEDKSPGPDSIHSMVLREATAEVMKPLTLIFLQ